MMLRRFEIGDLGELAGMVQKADRIPAQEIEERLSKWTAVVWEESGSVRGAACYQKEEEGEFNIRIFVGQSFRRQGIGDKLLRTSYDAVKAMGGRGRVTVRYRIDTGESQRFFRDRGFTTWYAMDWLSYDGERMSEPDLPGGVTIRHYQDADYEAFFRTMAQAFIPQRRFFDFRPHDVLEFHTAEGDRERVLANKDNMLVLVEGAKVVGIAELKGNFIDTVGVALEATGRGYGKALMLHATNLLRDRGHRVIETSVVLGNIPAWRLYNTLGFRRTQADEWACLWM